MACVLHTAHTAHVAHMAHTHDTSEQETPERSDGDEDVFEDVYLAHLMAHGPTDHALNPPSPCWSKQRVHS